MDDFWECTKCQCLTPLDKQACWNCQAPRAVSPSASPAERASEITSHPAEGSTPSPSSASRSMSRTRRAANVGFAVLLLALGAFVAYIELTKSIESRVLAGQPLTLDSALRLAYANWLTVLAGYGILLGALWWMNRSGYGKGWKVILWKPLFYVLMLPIYLLMGMSYIAVFLLASGSKSDRSGSLSGKSPPMPREAAKPGPDRVPNSAVPRDETVRVEFIDLSGGDWKTLTTAPNHPAAIRAAFANAAGSFPGRRWRAVGATTGTLYDMR